MKQKCLFIASLKSKKFAFDGERIKSSIMFDTLQKHSKVTCINLSKNRVIQTLKLFFLLTFKRYDKYIVSKAPLGADKILRFLRFFRVDKNKISFFIIGADLAKKMDNKEISYKNISYCSLIVCETDLLTDTLKNHNLPQAYTYPNFKKIYEIDDNMSFQEKETLSLVFLSRVVERKGIIDLVNSVISHNVSKQKFTLDIFGKSENDTLLVLNKLLKDRDDIHYHGPIAVNSISSYEQLNKYDLHVFPTRCADEGIPGTIIDFFIAHVPTLSSNYGNSRFLLDESFAYFFNFRDINSLTEQLKYIYDNQKELFDKRRLNSEQTKKYSIENFEVFLLNKILQK